MMLCFFADTDSDGNICVADARTILRMSVRLEEKAIYSFIVEEITKPDCKNSGYIKADCLNNNESVYLMAEKLEHSFSAVKALCMGTGNCLIWLIDFAERVGISEVTAERSLTVLSLKFNKKNDVRQKIGCHFFVHYGK